MTESSIAKAKMLNPINKPQHVPRPRLMNVLTDAVQGKMTGICAPPGYGKTTLIAEWIAATDKPCCTLTLDSIDNDESRFWRYMAHCSARALNPPAHEAVNALIQSMSSVSIFTFIDALLNELYQIEEETILILDDFHLIYNENLHEQLMYFIDYLPEKLHLIIASRSALPFSTLKWRLKAEAIELEAEKLMFTTEEALRFFENSIDPPPSIEQTEQLLVRTEGWITGLQLAMLSLQAGHSFSQLLPSFTGDHRHVADYLFHEVLTKLQENTRSFLMQTSILSRMDATLCNELLGREDSAAMLNTIKQLNLFLLPLDEQNHSYRYHKLFGEYMSAELKRENLPRWLELHQKAVNCLSARGQLPEAIEHAAAAGNFPQLEQMLEQQVYISLQEGELALLLRWFDYFPEAYTVSPELAIIHVFILLLKDQTVKAETIVQQVEAALPSIQPQERNREIQSGLLFVRSNLVFKSGEFEKWVAFSDFFLDRILPKNALFYNFNYNQSELFVRRTSMGMKGVLSSHTEQIAKLFTGVLQSHGWEHSLINLYVKQSLAEGYYEWNRLSDSVEILNETAAAITERKVPGLLVPHLLCKALRHAATSDYTLAHHYAEEAFVHVRELADANWQNQIRAFRLRLLLREGRISEAKLEGELLPVGSKDKPVFNREYVFLSYIRLLGKQRKQKDALQLLAHMKPLAQREGMLSSIMEIAMLQALLEHQQGHTELSFRSLQEALAVGESFQYIRSFVDEGEAMHDLLSLYLTRENQLGSSVDNDKSQYVKKLLAAFPVLHQDAPAKNPKALPEPLNQSELELLRQLRRGASNRQIAQALTLSEGTVKVYLSRLYNKLQVTSRTQALLIAQEMKLLQQ
ncbi:LuxR C-terminal-related transcriptional regulator [Paenibacillus sp. HB172176]|uniref:LuxR C-terminal-related transcriptional regulator n=1 Tax=Paenibacillus sp. HB172176 TaxID=2493690 RepID=UPI001F0FDA2D|nr:LuxR C-terminal-related transcriptional regulator [Paenibacillus sp. HB172176]